MTCSKPPSKRWSHRTSSLLALFALVAFTASCDNFFVSTNATRSISISPNSVLLKAAASSTTPGDSATLSAQQTTVGGTTSDVTSLATWSSSAPSVVTVTGGDLSAVGTTASSTATITASYGGKSSTANVLLFTGSAPTQLTVNLPTGITSNVSAGQTFRLTASASLSGNSSYNLSSPVNYVTWSSNAPSIATVDANGNVTVQNTLGNFTITATVNIANTIITGQSVQFTVI